MAIRINADFQAVYIHEPLGHNVPALNTAWTVAGLYRREAIAPAGRRNTLIVALYGTTAAGSWVGLYMNDDGTSCRLEGWAGTPSAIVTSSSYPLEQGRDYRLAIDYNGSGTLRLLVDGAVVLTLAFTPAAGTLGERSLQWGGYGELDDYTDCTIARWRMWSAVLTEAEHRAEYRSLAPVRTSGLLHNWPMNPGSGRFDDTIVGQPDLAENPAVPVTDGTAFIHRASIIGTPQFFDLGSTTTPGAQTINVPQYAERVVMFFHESDDAGTPDSTLSTLTSNFAGTFTLTRATASSVAMAVAVATANITATGAGRTFTPTFTAVNSVAGAGCWVVFLQDVGSSFPTGVDLAQATGAGATADTASAAGALNGLAIAVDTRLDPAAGNYPATQAGWTSLATGQETGPFTYWACSRIQQKFITVAGTESVTTQSPNGSCAAILTVPSAKLAPVIAASTKPGAWSVRNSVSTTRSGAWRVRNLASATRAGAWSVRNSAAATRGGAWTVRNLAAANRSGAWSIFNKATASQAGAWSVRALAVGSAASAWSVRSLASATYAGAWSVEAPGLASSTFSGGWTVRNPVAATTAGAWSVRTAASATKAGAWTVRVLQIGTFPGAWSVQEAGLAAGTFASSWSVRNRVQGAAAGAWSVRASTAGSFAGGWSVRNSAAQAFAGGWTVRALATGSYPGAWSLEGLVQAFFSGSWSVESDVPVEIEEAFIARPAPRNWIARNPRWGAGS